MKNILIGFIVLVLIVLLITIFRPKTEDSIKLSDDESLLGDGLITNPNQTAASSSKISVKSNAAWVAQVNSIYSLSPKGSEIYESPAAAIEVRIEKIYNDTSWYDNIKSRYNKQSKKEKRKNTMSKLILKDAIWWVREEDRYIVEGGLL